MKLLPNLINLYPLMPTWLKVVNFVALNGAGYFTGSCLYRLFTLKFDNTLLLSAAIAAGLILLVTHLSWFVTRGGKA